MVDNVGDSVNPVLGEWPVASVDTVANCREDGSIVARPKFWPEDDMAELSSVGNLETRNTVSQR